MSIIDQVREHYLKPANLGAELTLKQISAAINCDDDHRLGIDLWYLANKSRELKCEKNEDGKNVYRWNDQAGHRTAPGGAATTARSRKTSRKKRVAKGGKVRRYTRRNAAERVRLPVLPPHGKVAVRWALTDDGAFVDITFGSGGNEISPDRARALAEFIRKLDAARS